MMDRWILVWKVALGLAARSDGMAELPSGADTPAGRADPAASGEATGHELMGRVADQVRVVDPIEQELRNAVASGRRGAGPNEAEVRRFTSGALTQIDNVLNEAFTGYGRAVQEATPDLGARDAARQEAGPAMARILTWESPAMKTLNPQPANSGQLVP
jgi:hypothetical protein